MRPALLFPLPSLFLSLLSPSLPPGKVPTVVPPRIRLPRDSLPAPWRGTPCTHDICDALYIYSAIAAGTRRDRGEAASLRWYTELRACSFPVHHIRALVTQAERKKIEIRRKRIEREERRERKRERERDVSPREMPSRKRSRTRAARVSLAVEISRFATVLSKFIIASKLNRPTRSVGLKAIAPIGAMQSIQMRHDTCRLISRVSTFHAFVRLDIEM